MSGRRIPSSSSNGKQGMSQSYPPTNDRSRESLRRTEGWEMNLWGKFPEDPMASSMLNYNSSGYDASRSARFPDDSSMGRGYSRYKGYAAQASQASTEYKTERKALGSHNTKISPEGHRRLYEQAERVNQHRIDEAHSRDKFLSSHPGRRDHHYYKGHKKQVNEQNDAAERMSRTMREHQKYSRR